MSRRKVKTDHKPSPAADLNAFAPLSAHATAALRRVVEEKGVPTQTLNPGVTRKLVDEQLCTVEFRDSPYPSHKKGTRVPYLIAALGAERRIVK